jgi:oligoribonuclease NrnB/cAMP/cGMP phosphodiesterase (DHH superfamily)
MMKVLIFSHEADLDGVYSAAIGLLRYPQAMTVFLGYGAENFQKMGNFIYSATHFSKERGLVIIADLGLNDDTIEVCRGIFDDAVRNGWKLMWVDHHPWSQAALDMAHQYCELVHDPSGKKCAADLMADKLLPGNELAASLASMAHTMDFFTKDQYLTPITELIKYYQTFPNFYERLAELAKKSANGILWDVEMQGEYVKYTKLRDEAKLQALSSMQVRQVGNSGVKVAFVPASPYLQSSLFSEEVLVATGADLVMFYSSRGKVSIRRSGDKISCRQVAANLPEGGGHDYAAGATFRSDPSDVAAVVAELESAVSRALQSNASNTLKEQPPNP